MRSNLFQSYVWLISNCLIWWHKKAGIREVSTCIITSKYLEKEITETGIKKTNQVFRKKTILKYVPINCWRWHVKEFIIQPQGVLHKYALTNSWAFVDVMHLEGSLWFQNIEEFTHHCYYIWIFLRLIIRLNYHVFSIYIAELI